MSDPTRESSDPWTPSPARVEEIVDMMVGLGLYTQAHEVALLGAERDNRVRAVEELQRELELFKGYYPVNAKSLENELQRLALELEAARKDYRRMVRRELDMAVEHAESESKREAGI